MDRNADKRISFWELAPHYVNDWRVFPRAFVVMYFWLLWRVVEWFLALPDPSGSQAAFASAVIGAGAGWFGLYVGTPRQGGFRPSAGQYGRDIQ